MLGKLLCFIGVHDWEYRAFYDGTRLTHNYNLYHRCRRCSSQAWEPVKGTER